MPTETTDTAAPADPFGTAGRNAAVLAAWAASPSRFREDANAEEALARGYTDRALIELAANAVDAAAVAGVPAHLAVTLHADAAGPQEIRVANTGAPLTADGVAALASLRASAKRAEAGTVGHFGVGFTAVLELTDTPRIVSTSGGVGFSAARTADAVAAQEVPALTDELAARHGVLPTLRLCWPAGDREPPPAGFTTEVRLPLRPGTDGDAVLARWRAAVTDHLLWALPALNRVDVGEVTVERTLLPDGRTEVTGPTGTRVFSTVQRTGELPAELLAALPVEQRQRSAWRICWVLPDEPHAEPTALCAPTPTDERITLPAKLFGTFEVDDTRRHLASGALTDHLLDRAAQTYLDLVAASDHDRRWELVPPTGFPAGEIDARLRTDILTSWRAAPLLLGVLGEPVAPAAAVTVPGLNADAMALVAEALPGVVVPPTIAARTAARTLGVAERGVAEAVDALTGLHRPPAFWRRVYDAVADADAESLTGLVVPLIDGRQVIGARGVMLPDEATTEAAAAAGRVFTGLRVAHPDAVHPLLLRLGAQQADAGAILSAPAVHGRLSGLPDELDDDLLEPDEQDRIATVVLDLVAAGGRGEPAALAGVVLTTDDDEPWPAGGLLLPDSPLRDLVPDDDMPTVHTRWVQRWGEQTLVAVGVRGGPLVIDVTDPRAEELLPDLDDWLDTLPAGLTADPEGLQGVADLELIDERDWPAALQLLAVDRRARDAVLQRHSYTGWWLARQASIDGRRIGEYRTDGAADLAGLFPVLPLELDPPFAAAVGAATDRQTALLTDPQGLLDRFCSDRVLLPPLDVPGHTAALARVLAERPDLQLPDQMRTVDGSVAAADLVVVPDGPWWAAVLPAGRLAAPGHDPAATAEAFGLDLASGRHRIDVTEAGDAAADDARRTAATESAGSASPELPALVDGVGALLPVLPDVAGWRVRPNLAVAVDGGEPQRVGWWWTGDGAVVDGTPVGVAAAIAWACGRWTDRWLLAAALGGDSGPALVAACWDAET